MRYSCRMPTVHYPSIQRGFNYLQLLIVLLCMALFASMAVTNWQRFIVRNRSVAAMNQLSSILHFARNTALIHGLNITLCHSDDHRHCRGSWSDGYLVFVDHNRNHHVDPEEEILRVVGRQQRGAQLVWHGIISKDYLQFNPSVLHTLCSGHFSYCPNGRKSRDCKKLVLNRAGRSRLSA